MNRRITRTGILLFGYAFLYMPILGIVIFSFNISKISNVWQGFSTKWYTKLFENEAIQEGLWNSLRIASISATIAMIIGVLAAFSLVRYKKFKGRNIFESTIHMPLVMPEVITGLSLMVFLYWARTFFYLPASSGISPIVIAHTTLGIAYVTVVVRSRLSEYDMDVEEAALDLGATPLTVFFRITIPIITPACLAGWFLAFALSFDDVVLASFLSSPESTTLPMVVFSSLKLGGATQINALATIMVAVVSIAVILGGIITHRRQKIASKLCEG